MRWNIRNLMKLQVARTANRRTSNIEPQNVEGWFRFAQSTFDIHYSIFNIRFFNEWLGKSLDLNPVRCPGF
jgi:hypothetical protein